MKVLWSQLVLRDPRRRPPPSDSDVAASAPRTFGIIIRSIRSLQEVEQRRHISNAKLEEPVSASLVPEATENLVGKGVVETWSVENGYLKPVIDTICLEFTIVGQTQRFESVHRIVNNGGSVIFCSNRPPAEPDRPSPLEVHVQEYSNNPAKKVIKAHHKEKLAVRSRTWPSKMESLRRWSRAPGNQHSKKKLQDKPLIRFLAQGLMQQGETGTGTVRGDICGCSEQGIASAGIRGYEETESSVKPPRGLDRATAKEDKGPNLAKSFQFAGSPNPVTTSSKEVVESDSCKQDPDDSNETDTWDFCQVSEKASRKSSDGDGLPFPDDYWIYDEKAKNYYHKELGDDGKETISWYPLEFD
ncbi:hypothetical protein E8E14_004475 [Neopestalotiopsis sp. 37M]|nr:hypothetical protein E8E14_004475 [Neopestalotiopsis sp. 37M]